MYAIQFPSSALADIKSIPKHLREPIKKELLKKVALDPVGCSKELHGKLHAYRSFVWQEYRIVYRVFFELRVVAVVGIGSRSPQSVDNIYRRLEALANAGELAADVLFSLRGFSEGEDR